MLLKSNNLVLQAFLLLCIVFPAQAKQDLYTRTEEGRPFAHFEIFDKGEIYGREKFGNAGDASTWTMQAPEINSLKIAAEHWASRIGSVAKGDDYALVSVGTYKGSNADTYSATIVTPDAYAGHTEFIGALLGRSLPDNSYTAQLRMGYTLGTPHLDYAGPLEVLPHNGDPTHLTAIWVHELGHALGVMVNVGKDDITGNFGFSKETSRMTDYLVDENGNPAKPEQLITQTAQGDSFVLAQGNYAFFQGPQTLKTLDGAVIGVTSNPNQVLGMPVNGWERGMPELSHLELPRSVMSHQQYINYCTFLEAELALLQDIGLVVDQKNFYGFSLYKDNETLYNDQGFFARNQEGTAYLPGQYNYSAVAIGLHVFGSYNTVYQRADILSAGFGSAGIRVDGTWGNNLVFIEPGVRVHALGERGTGLLVAYGIDQIMVHRGELAADYGQGVGARFDYGDNMNSNAEFEYRGSYIWQYSGQVMDPATDLPEVYGPLVKRFDVTGSLSGDQAAIFISENAHVQEINIMQGAKIKGDIVSAWNPQNPLVRYHGDINDIMTSLNFGLKADASGQVLAGQADPDFTLAYYGQINGPASLNVQVAGGTLGYWGTMDIRSFKLAANAGLSPILGRTSEINAENIILEPGSVVEPQISEYFTYGPLMQGRQAVLCLNASQSLDNQSQVAGASGAFSQGAYDYTYNNLAWDTTAEVLAMDASPRFNQTRGAVSAVGAPSAIAASGQAGILLQNRLASRFAHKWDNSQQMAALLMGITGQRDLALQQPITLLTGFADSSFDNEQPLWMAGPDGGGGLYLGNSSLWLISTFSFTNSSAGAGYNLETPAWAAGFDTWLSPNLFLGLAVYGSLPQFASADADVDAKNITGTLYGGLLLPLNLELGAFVAYGHTTYNQARRVADQYLSSDYAANNLGAGLNLGRNFSLAPALSLRPFLAYEFMRVGVDGYTENNNIYALNIGSHHEKLHFLRAGTDITYTWVSRAYASGRIYYAGLYGDNQASTQAFFSLDPGQHSFSSVAEGLDENSLGLGLSAGLPLGENMDISAGYNCLLGQNTTTHQATLGMTLKF